MKKKFVLLFVVLLALIVGVVAAIIRNQKDTAVITEKIEREAIIEKSEDTLQTRTPTSKPQPTRQGDVYKFKPAGTGKPLEPKELVLEKPNLDEASRSVHESKPKKDILDDINPKIKALADQLEELVDSFDEETLQTTKKIIETIPLVEMEPEEAKLRPKDGGLELKIVIPADTIRFKKDTKPSSGDG